MLAVAMSVMNFSDGLGGELLGTVVNDNFIHVSSDDLSGYWIMNYIVIGCLFYEIIIVRLIPLRKDVEE
jgi:hypothetical protein